MENENTQDVRGIVKTVIEELVNKIGIACEVEMEEFDQNGQKTLAVNIKTTESNYLIGQYGVNLQALQHIARVIARKKTDTRADFILDVNSYRQEKNESIAALAKSMAEQAMSERRAVVLRPMSPYERRLIHLELSKNDQVRTESIGEGEDRRVVIKPTDLV
ncbi:MAG: R3H domain-containing nucleic acid-binding protein [Candidatus Pacebacteria bacterium]|nr:R3H domain-containing nucleic acid-binding protein [Candidatus Paceibacterota bacterium]MDR3583252.1 R3H domain-containing nucleic acid-binding protein [Candidatus Paceibacterota bacterium]